MHVDNGLASSKMMHLIQYFLCLNRMKYSKVSLSKILILLISRNHFILFASALFMDFWQLLDILKNLVESHYFRLQSTEIFS